MTAGWHYGEAFDIYDHPSWDTMVAKGWGLTQAATRRREFRALVDRNDTLVGFLRFMQQKQAVAIGLGLRPDCCGRGLGAAAMAALHAEALRNQGPCLLRLEVRTFDRRAIRCYERAGWQHVAVTQQVTALGPGEFAVMERHVGENDRA